ncbi:MAG TPA: AtpZ/AtpI family protein [Cyclobacteriaceae bacterium]|nr:AtpZ/AtpI family protein [Cyclobacteriaceae bacterium]
MKYSNLGLQLLLVIGVCSWAGLRIDSYLGLKFPAFLLSFTLVSFAGMMYKLYRSLNE